MIKMHSDSFVEMPLNRKAKCLDQKRPIPKFPLSSILLVSLIYHLLSPKLSISANPNIIFPGVETGNLESSLIVLFFPSTTIAIISIFYFCLQNIFQSAHIHLCYNLLYHTMIFLQVPRSPVSFCY